MNAADPRKTFFRVAFLVFAAVFGLVLFYTTLIVPRTYTGVAQVALAGNGDLTSILPAQADVALSEAVLNPVVERLNLNALWGRKIRVDGALKTWETVTLLKQKIAVTPLEGTNALEFRVDFVDDGAEAAKIANAVAETYCALPSLAAGGLRAAIVSRAQPELRPTHPNIPFNLSLGAVGGLVLALTVGGVAASLVSQLNLAAAKNAATAKTT